MLWRTRVLMSALTAFLSVLIGATAPARAQSTEEEQDWQHAQAIGTVHEYEKFLQKYPDSIHAPDAVRALLEERVESPTYRSAGESNGNGGY